MARLERASPMPLTYPLRAGGSRSCACTETLGAVSIYGSIWTQKSTLEVSATGIFLPAHPVHHQTPEPQRQQAEERRPLAGRVALVIVEGAGESAGFGRRRVLL